MREKGNILIKKTKDKGKTYIAKRNFKKGETLLYITGPIVKKPSDYTIPIGFGLFINPTEFGGKYINDYGDEANLGINNRTQLVAMRTIKKGEEIGPAYFMFVPFYSIGSTGERLNLTCFKNLSKKKKEKYKKFISDFLFNEKEVKDYKKFI